MEKASGTDARIVDYENRDYRVYWEGIDKQHEHEHECRVLRKLLPGNETGWFLDLGCAHGRLLPLYDKPGRQIVLLDYSMVHMEIAAKQCRGPNHHFIAADAYHLPFRDGTFNGLLSVRVFHHMANPQGYLDEVGRVMEPGGRAVVEFANKRNLMRIVRRGPSSFRHDHISYDGDMLFGTHPAYFKEAARLAGLELRRSEGTGSSDQIVRLSPLLRWPGRVVEPVVDGVLGMTGLAPQIFADLEKVGGEKADATLLMDVLVCPACQNRLRDEGSALACMTCGRVFERRGEILDFRLK